MESVRAALLSGMFVDSTVVTLSTVNDDVVGSRDELMHLASTLQSAADTSTLASVTHRNKAIVDVRLHPECTSSSSIIIIFINHYHHHHHYHHRRGLSLNGRCRFHEWPPCRRLTHGKHFNNCITNPHWALAGVYCWTEFSCSWCRNFQTITLSSCH